MIDLNITNQRLVDPKRQQYMRQLAAAISTAQLSIIKKGDGRAYVRLIDSFLGTGARSTPAAGLPSGTAIILFADIVASTALTERMGDAAFRAKARDLDTALRAVIAEAGGTTIDAKTLGDGVLATFPAASQAIAAALACGAAGEAQGLPLHLGLHAGDVIREANNVYGGAVNIAARISALSAPGEVLVSRTVADLARTSASVTFEDRGEHALKGVADPQRVFAVRKDGA
jgi:class 3 adenylate cyclase